MRTFSSVMFHETRFGDVIRLLTESLGASAPVLIFKTVEEFYRDYKGVVVHIS